jgi:F-type H+-transporting ATPase subunit a
MMRTGRRRMRSARPMPFMQVLPCMPALPLLPILLAIVAMVSAAGPPPAWGGNPAFAQHELVANHETTANEGSAPSHEAAASEEPATAHDNSPALELPDIIHNLKVYFGGPENAERPTNFIDFLYAWRGNIFALVILIMISILMLRGAAKREMIPGEFQNAVEYVVEAFYNFIHGILGENARAYVPFLGTLFLYIWFMNLSGLVPLWKAPTSLFETTLALALVVFLYVQSIGLRRLGIGGYLYHMVGSPKDGLGWGLVPLMLPLHLIEEVARPVSLSLRLFGNIMGEDVLIAVFTWLGVASLSVIHSPIGIPLEFPFIFLGLLLSTIQALVFTLLSTIYISQMLPHEHEEHEG